MKNKIPLAIPALLTFAGETAIGAGQYGAALPLLHNTQAAINGDISPLVDANTAYEAGKAELATRRTTLNTLSDTCRELIILGRDNCKPTFGSQFNNSWTITGFKKSLRAPKGIAELLPMVGAFREFLEANPSFEVTDKQITATNFGTLFTQLEAASGAVNLQETLVGQLKETRDQKFDALYNRMRDLIGELKGRLGSKDQRWKAFGLNMPGAAETPDQVVNVKATLIGPTAAAMKWDATARADYYRVWKKVVGVDADPIAVGSPADLDFTMENLPSGATIEIYVSAVNDGGEGQLSEKVTVTTHP